MRGGVKKRQFDASDCGVASLASVAAYYGIQIPLSVIRVNSGTDSGGTTIKGMVEAAREIGFEAEGYKGTCDSLSKIPLPAILHIAKEGGMLHYQVLYSVNDSKCRVMDPSDGQLHRISLSELLKEWTGYMILFTPPAKGLSKIFNRSGVGGFLFKMLVKRLRFYSSVLTLSVIQIIVSISVSLFIRELLDNVIPSGDNERLFYISVYLVCAIVAAVIVSVFKQRLLLWFAIDTNRELTEEYINHIHMVPLNFLNSFKTGEIVSRLNDIYKIGALMAGTLVQASISLLTLSLALFILFKTDCRLALFCLLFIPVFVTIFLIHDRFNKPLMKKSMESAAKFQSAVIESIKGMATIKNYVIESVSSANLKGRLGHLHSQLLKAGKASVAASAAAELTLGMLTVSILCMGGAAVLGGALSVGQMISFYTITMLFSGPLQQLSSVFATVREGSTATARYCDIISAPAEGYSKNHGEVNEKYQPGYCDIILKADAVSFAYSGRDTLFQNLSFEVAGGEVLAVTGESGCGKSTLVSIILRHLKPVSGKIFFNMTDISLTDIEWWRSNISVVPQNPSLYGDTILDCIACGCDLTESKTKSLLKEAISALELLKMSEQLPAGLASNAGECGALLSRGQQQRIAFARAYIRDPSVVILDEATSSLDHHSSLLIYDMVLLMKKRGKAVIMITHDSSLCQKADKILRL